MSTQYEYSEYLKRRSPLGLIYRKFFLFSRIDRLLKGSVLDVGCGIGDMLAFRSDAVGVDVNPHNVEFCRARGLNAHVMPFDRIPFQGENFDSVLLDNVLEHIAKPDFLLAEIKRVLRPNGILVIGVPGLKGQSADLDHKVYYDETALDALAEESGFKVMKYMYAPLFRSAFLSRTLAQYCIYTQWQKID